MSTEDKLWYEDTKLLFQLIDGESREVFPYVDTVGKISIGIGRNLTDRGLSQDEIDLLYRNDVINVVNDLNKHLPWWKEMSDNRQRVILDMCFNLGIQRLLGFTTTLGLMRSGHYKEAAAQMLRTKWRKQVKGRALRLAAMMEEG